jgi:hypothetical protein
MSCTITRRAALSIALQALVARAAVARVGPTPFGIANRTMPSGHLATDLLPPTVGGFRREALTDAARVPTDDELLVTYRRGTDSVSLGASVADTSDEARAAVETAAHATREHLRLTDRRDELPRMLQDLAGEPAYVAVSDFIAWSRDRHFFAARASSPRALAAFMHAFPY